MFWRFLKSFEKGSTEHNFFRSGGSVGLAALWSLKVSSRSRDLSATRNFNHRVQIKNRTWHIKHTLASQMEHRSSPDRAVLTNSV